MRKNRILLVLSVIVLLLSVIASPVKADPAETVRVWVAYRDGESQKFWALNSNGSKIRFDFPELSAYVVSLPAAALNSILNNPWVIDVEEDAEAYPISEMAGQVTKEALDVVDQNGQTVLWYRHGQARVRDVNQDGFVDDSARLAQTGLCVSLILVTIRIMKTTQTPLVGIRKLMITGLAMVLGMGLMLAALVLLKTTGLGVVGVTPGTVNLLS